MKIIEMERRTMDGDPVVYDDLNECAGEYRDWWCVIETEEEKLVYDAFLNGDNAGEGGKLFRALWNAMVKHAGLGLGLKWGDDDVYGYVMPHEYMPEVGDECMDADNDKWVRTQ